MTNIIYVRHEASDDESEIGDSPSETVKLNCFGYPVQSPLAAAPNKEEIEVKVNLDDVAVVESENQELTPFLVGIPRRRSISTRVNKNLPNNLQGEQVAAGWPIWLVSVASEAIHGWTPIPAHTFEKLHQISRGARSEVHKAKDTATGKIVALKKVRIDKFDSASLRSMARQLIILRRLAHHPNIIKLEGLVVSSKNKRYCKLQLVFEYMEHSLSDLATSRGIKFTETQVKSYMHQLLSGLEHFHGHGVLHRNLNGSNLLIDNEGRLKIAGFGSALFFDPKNGKPMSCRVASLWYRAPELILGVTNYGVGIDLWSTGCLLGELLSGQPIMSGCTQVEQLHKIFKLCGSPSEAYWRTAKLSYANASLFMPQYPYKRCIVKTFKTFSPSSLRLMEILLAIDPVERQTATASLKSEFFTVKPSICQ
ncbi:hypothetical protein C5167_028900 [Papaver somniferum]|uniref:probable serine/threonine-protein kinase At1g54610 n=1 Tax=Papaver somniferum TaxID=3469 RepID=UPI000E6F70BA|nr:probable serine/threonine-protein kinase At1g54610 [Papaver somniferum]RZC91066.1 hypothetical protein C5167_028900 [Papaver somniferum]